MKLKKFLDKYDTIIFDMDGVITSEQNYWTCAALTVYEFFHSRKYFGDEDIDIRKLACRAANIRNIVFCGDALIENLKKQGINSNWDLAYVIISLVIINNTFDFNEILRWLTENTYSAMDLYDYVASHLKTIKQTDCSRNSDFWYNIQSCFQEWFLGDELFYETYGRIPIEKGKKGLIHNEKPLISHQKLTLLFQLLYNDGKRICTGTGRPSEEIYHPLCEWGIFKYIASDGFINYSHVQKAEKNLGLNLTKPHPYMFLKALYGEYYPDENILKGKYNKEKIGRTLIVGDAGADIGAAHAMGADFCAVLTGISGEHIRPYFEQNRSEYILNSVEDFLER